MVVRGYRDTELDYRRMREKRPRSREYGVGISRHECGNTVIATRHVSSRTGTKGKHANDYAEAMLAH